MVVSAVPDRVPWMVTMTRAPHGAAAAVGRLAAEVTSFVDRDHEVSEVKRLLSLSRLVTLTGVGGIGKTRLAVRAASQVRRVFADGVWQIDVSGLRDGAVVQYALAETWGIRGTIDRPISQMLAHYVVDREVLLLLDNCEHLLDACAELAAWMLKAGPGVRVLCTSRQPLGVVGEAVWDVPPLPVPRLNGVSDAPGNQTYAALTLFVARATAANQDFTVTPDNHGTVVEICRRLDGLPLAIELAAARLRALSVGQLAAGLTNRFGLLSARHAVPEHHRTLRATFEWSFALCTEQERALWTRIAVFRSGFDVEAITAVCADESLPADSMLNLLVGLVDKSIVLRDRVAGPARYRLLDSVREYGLDLLRADDDLRAAMARRHADWYVRCVEEFDRAWFGPEQTRLSASIKADLDNIRAALGYCLTTPGQVRASLRLAAALRYYWTTCGGLGEGRYWLARALAADPAPTVERAAALSAHTRVLITQGSHADAAASAAECLELARQLDDPRLVTWAIQDLGMQLLVSGADLPRAQTLLEEALARYDRIDPGDNASIVLAMASLAMTTRYLEDRERAERLCADCLRLCRAHGDRWYESNTLFVAAVIALADADPARATRYLRQALPAKIEFGDIVGIGQVLDDLGRAAAIDEDYERSARLTGAAHRIRRDLGQPGYESTYTEQGRWASGPAMRWVKPGTKRPTGTVWNITLEQAVADALDAKPGPPATPPSAAPDLSPLTRREREVAELIAQGLSNRQIAARLLISKRTVESHAENILRKLGFTSRTQVATWITRQDHR